MPVLARLLFLTALLFLLPSASAQAAAPPWPTSSYAYYATNEQLRQVLKDFGQNFGVRTEISARVQGTVTGRLFADTPSAFLDKLGTAYGFTWYYYGGTLYVNSGSETQSRSIELTQEDVTGAREALLGLGVLDERFGWGEFRERGVIMVSGPPQYVALVEKTLRSLPVRPNSGMTVSVFRLKHAAADDRTYSYRDQQVTVPGVATILRNIITNQTNASSGTRTERTKTSSIPNVRGNVFGTPVVVQTASSASSEAGDANRKGGGNRVDAPTESAVIQSDTRLNAVIVKDLADRMPTYAQLIEMLDVQTSLIEIEAAVVDVNTSKTKDLGIRWRGQSGNVAAGFGTISSATPTDSAISIGVGSSNVSLSTILDSSGRFFLSQVSILETTGDATIQSRPSVLTLDNLQAVLDLSETFYIKVEGENVADVMSVSAGTLLKVTPRLVEKDGMRKITLDIDVEDGTIETTKTFSDIPTVKKSTISTQAVVGPDESVLIGGYYYEAKTANVNKVPLLGDIPVLGYLFKQTEDEVQKRQRMFLISPRIINATTLPGAGGVQSSPLPMAPAAPERRP